MAVLWVKPIWSGRDGDADEQHRRYTSCWRIRTTSPLDGPMTVGNAAGLPKRYEGYVFGNDSDPSALCVGLSPKQDQDDARTWIVTAKYSTDYMTGQEGGDSPQDQNPLNWSTVWSVDFEEFTRATTKDKDGQPIVNSAGQLIAGIEREDSYLVLVAQKNLADLDFNFVADYNNSTNSAGYKGFGPRELKLKIRVGELAVHNGFKYYPHTFRFTIKEDKWDIDPVDRGTAVKDASGRLVVARDAFEQPLQEVNLDGAGKLLAAGQPLKYVSDFTGQSTRLLKERAFAALTL